MNSPRGVLDRADGPLHRVAAWANSSGQAGNHRPPAAPAILATSQTNLESDHKSLSRFARTLPSPWKSSRTNSSFIDKGRIMRNITRNITKTIAEEIRIEPGQARGYELLAPFHYRQSQPHSGSRVLVAATGRARRAAYRGHCRRNFPRRWPACCAGSPAAIPGGSMATTRHALLRPAQPRSADDLPRHRPPAISRTRPGRETRAPDPRHRK